ncbi:PRAME family member 8-like [Thomomys bottae]
MDLSTPPSLQRLAMQSLLSNQSLAISALEDLPVLLFPSLFLEAYATGLTEVLKAMVQAWPFYCLRLGNLIKSPDLNTFKAVLRGLDLLLAKKERCSHCKLQVLDLRSEPQDIRTLGYPSMDGISYPTILTDSLTTGRHSWMMKKHPFIIAFDLTVKEGPQEILQTYLLQWVRDRKEQVQFYSRRLKIQSDCISNIQKVFHLIRLDSIQDLMVSELGFYGTICKFTPLMGLMKNLHVLHISNMSIDFSTSSHKNSCYSSKFGAYLGQLQHLQELHFQRVFLYRKLPTIFRRLKTLKTLSLSSCVLEEEDLKFLSQATCTKQLKHLRLSSFFMGSFRTKPLQALLEQVAGTLQTLALEDCHITDAQLLAILPILSQCSQLSFFSFFGNRISMASLQMLLSHTAQMSHLKRGIYPAPLESYHPGDWFLGNINPERFARVLTGLTQSPPRSGWKPPVGVAHEAPTSTATKAGVLMLEPEPELLEFKLLLKSKPP